MFCSSDRSSRMTKDILKVSVVGRANTDKGSLFQKAEFTATSLASGMYPVRVSQVVLTTISENDFINFYN